MTIVAFNCPDCALAYVKHHKRCVRHRKGRCLYTVPYRLAECTHSAICKTHTKEGPDPLDNIPTAKFWQAVTAFEEDITHCHLCSVIYTGAYFRTGISWEEWVDKSPKCFALRKHSPTCLFNTKGGFELQGAGNSTMARTPPRTRVPRPGFLAEQLGGPQLRPDTDLTRTILSIVDGGGDATNIITAVDAALKQKTTLSPRATLSEVWRQLHCDNCSDRAAALLTAVTLWYADKDALDPAHLASVQAMRGEVSNSWYATLKGAVERLENWFVQHGFGTHMRRILELISELLAIFADGHATIDALLQALKPIPLMALITTYDGTPLGMTTLLLGILQLYGLLDAGLISDCASAVIDVLSCFMTRVMNQLSPFGPSVEPQSTTSFAIAFGAMIIVWIIGHMPSYIATELRRAATTATSILAIVKIGKLAFDLARRHVTSTHVNQLTSKAIQLSVEVVRPKDNSAASSRRASLQKLKALQDEIQACMIKVDYAVHLSTLKALSASCVALIIRLNQIEGQAMTRDPPVGAVFCGPPGIGKTTLATWVLSQIAPDTIHSTFSMQVDHADAYSGEDTCLWDEFDTDQNYSFVEGVIGIFNKTAYPLNCDLAENKGRIFTSKVVAMTTNTETPVQPDNPRAHAFYRRLIFYDITSPAIDRFMAENPGCDPPPALFKDDFSHLRITRRPYLAYTARGDTLDGNRARPISCSPAAIVKEIKARMPAFEVQSGINPVIGLVVPQDLAASVRTMLLQKFTTTNSFVKLVEAGSTALNPNELHNPRGGHVIVTSDHEDPAVTDWHVVTHCVEANDLNSMLGLCPRLSSDINIGFRTRLFRSIIHAGALPPSALPTEMSFTVNSVADFLGALRKVYGTSILPVLVQIAGKITVKSWTSLFVSLSDVTWGTKPHSYTLKTPTGILSVYTHNYMAVYSNADLSTITCEKPHVSSLTVWQLFKSICSSLCKIFVSHLNSAATATAIAYYSRLAQAQPQAAGRGMVRNYQAGVALSDEEYNTWREYQSRVDRSATISDFIAARDALANNQAIAQERVAALATWMRARAAPEFQLQNADYIDFCKRVLRADGSFLGWAIHIGNGRWAMNTHLLEQADTIDGQKFDILRFSTDDISVVTSEPASAVAKLGAGPPVRTWDSRVCHNVIEHNLRGQQISATGWLTHVQGGTMKGDCGLPYFNSAGQVCGMHSGMYVGSKQAMISKFDTKQPTPMTWRGLPVENSGLQLGPLRKGTAYCRSVAHPEKYAWESYEPAPYGSADPRPQLLTQEKILAAQLDPYLQQPPPLHPIVVEAASYVQRHLSNLLSFCPAPAVESLPIAIKRLDLSTSCGPFVPGTKSDYFISTASGPMLKPGTEMTRHLDCTVAIASTGRPICHAYQLALKDELLPERKIKESRKRLLWGTDVGLTTLAAMVWGQLLDNLKSVVVASPISVGCQMDSTFTATIISQVTDKHTLCLDYKKWDSTMHPEVIRLAINILCDMVPDTPFTESLRATLCSPPVGYFMDKKVTALRGLPSGMPGTSVVNSVCHCIYFVSALWLTEDGACIARTRDPLVKNRIWTYGDDCIYALCPRSAANALYFTESLKALGLQPTAPDKTQNYSLDRDITFLKRDIVPLGNLVVGRLDLESILRQAVWVKGGSNTDHTVPRLPVDIVARETQIKEALLALSLHGETVYEKWLPLFKHTIDCEGLDVEIEPWDFLHNIYSTRYYTADVYSNAMLGEGEINTKAVANDFEFQNGDENRQTPATTSSEGFSAAPVGAEGGGVQVSYTPSQAVAAAAGGPVPDSMALSTLGAGLPSNLPIGVQGLFVASARFSWNTSQPVRQQVGYIPLTPQLNPFTQLLSGMYAGWSGGMLARIQISGSGMFGGRLIATVIPPGIRPGNIGNPTAYPHVIIDARVPEPVEIYIPDIRTGTYHRMEDEDDTCALLLTVSAPLINPFAASTGAATTSAAEVTVYTTPSPEFCFCLLKEPTQPDTTLAGLLGTTTANWILNRAPVGVQAFVTVASAKQSWNHYQLDGGTYGWGLGDVWKPVLFSYQNASSTINSGFGIEVEPIKENDEEYWPDPTMHPNFPDWVITKDLTSGNASAITNQCTPFWSISTITDGAYWVSVTNANDVLLAYGIITSGNATGASFKMTGSSLVGVGQPIILTMSANLSNPTNPRFYCVPTFPYCVNKPIGQLQSPGARTGYASPGNSILLLQGQITGATASPSTGHTTINATQPTCLSKTLASRSFPLNSNSMAVYRLSNGTNYFELGVRYDGYLMTGGADQVTIGVDTDYDITYVGMSSIDTRLMGPVVASASSRNR
ncbi:polyprotein [Turkey calicivirus]|uniref:Genome polyprotein n=1 Tax=Turkey calicivirus TaxID=1172195 RepID=I0DHL5_9CALI|nr:polyprotein [Turkey calicivirus]AFH89833.1 polyprotein [Turkey calicivirus]